MKFWPFPLWRLHKTSEAISDLFLAFAASRSLEIQQHSPTLSGVHVRVSADGLGELLIWVAKDPREWASHGAWIKPDSSVMEWVDHMPSRYAIRQMQRAFARVADAKEAREAAALRTQQDEIRSLNP